MRLIRSLAAVLALLACWATGLAAGAGVGARVLVAQRLGLTNGQASHLATLIPGVIHLQLRHAGVID